jgi:membrane-bound serine protease (ClpP class)
MKFALLMTILAGCALFALGVVVALYRHKHKVTNIHPLIGAQGEVITALAPDGTVLIKGELWAARSFDRTLISTTAHVEIAGSEDHLLLVKPSE